MRRRVDEHALGKAIDRAARRLWGRVAKQATKRALRRLAELDREAHEEMRRRHQSVIVIQRAWRVWFATSKAGLWQQMYGTSEVGASQGVS